MARVSLATHSADRITKPASTAARSIRSRPTLDLTGTLTLEGKWIVEIYEAEGTVERIQLRKVEDMLTSVYEDNGSTHSSQSPVSIVTRDEESTSDDGTSEKIDAASDDEDDRSSVNRPITVRKTLDEEGEDDYQRLWKYNITQ